MVWWILTRLKNRWGYLIKTCKYWGRCLHLKMRDLTLETLTTFQRLQNLFKIWYNIYTREKVIILLKVASNSLLSFPAELHTKNYSIWPALTWNTGEVCHLSSPERNNWYYFCLRELSGYTGSLLQIPALSNLTLNRSYHISHTHTNAHPHTQNYFYLLEIITLVWRSCSCKMASLWGKTFPHLFCTWSRNFPSRTQY